MAENIDGYGDEFRRIADEDMFMRYLRSQDRSINRSFSGSAEINGIKIVVEWDEGYEDYVLYLPQVDIGYARAEGFDTPDQLMRLGSDTKTASTVFREASAVAEATTGVYGLYGAMEQKLIERTA
jgi:hypothetical protein